MRVFVTGLSGMLGHSLAVALGQANHAVTGCGTRPREGLGLPFGVGYEAFSFSSWNDVAVLSDLVGDVDIVIHAAAFTNVDRAELDEMAAHLVNSLYTQAVVRVCEVRQIDLVYLSSDYVFDGRASRPYQEWDSPCPLGAYGRSKLAGELAARRLPHHYVVRTAWLFGEYGPNFVSTIARVAKESPELRVVDDQFGSPTYCGDLAEAISRLIATQRFGIHHLTNSGVTSWFGFAQVIVGALGLPTRVVPQSTLDAARPAPRPGHGVLDNWAWRVAGEPPLPSWQDALARYLDRSGLR